MGTYHGLLSLNPKERFRDSSHLECKVKSCEMFSLEETLQTACSKKSIPNATVHAADRKGEDLKAISPRPLLRKSVDDKPCRTSQICGYIWPALPQDGRALERRRGILDRVMHEAYDQYRGPAMRGAWPGGVR